jgi:hypothetical protein
VSRSSFRARQERKTRLRPSRVEASTRRPDFFIVGTFKSGTTALYEYLRRHPRVFMPFHKEPHFFGSDLTNHYGRISEKDYLKLFAAAAPGQRVGEASTWYLYSSTAAQEIAEFSPEAQIIVLLRNPVDVMYAQHSQLRYRGDEPIADFSAALAAEDERRRGQRLPPPPVRPETLFYRHSVQYAEQLERYLKVFGNERVHMIIFDDLVDHTPLVYRQTLEFLGVDPEFQPEFIVHNANKRVRSHYVQRLLFSPPGPIRDSARWLRRFPLVHRLRDAAMRINSAPASRDQLDTELRARLTEEIRPEIARLGELIHRDLSAWLA